MSFRVAIRRRLIRFLILNSQFLILVNCPTRRPVVSIVIPAEAGIQDIATRHGLRIIRLLRLRRGFIAFWESKRSRSCLPFYTVILPVLRSFSGGGSGAKDLVVRPLILNS